MEPFFCAATGKKLPGKDGQQDLIAAPRALQPNAQAIGKPAISGLARHSL
jgi:hypothetical protein